MGALGGTCCWAAREPGINEKRRQAGPAGVRPISKSRPMPVETLMTTPRPLVGLLPDDRLKTPGSPPTRGVAWPAFSHGPGCASVFSLQANVQTRT